MYQTLKQIVQYLYTLISLYIQGAIYANESYCAKKYFGETFAESYFCCVWKIKFSWQRYFCGNGPIKINTAIVAFLKPQCKQCTTPIHKQHDSKKLRLDSYL